MSVGANRASLLQVQWRAPLSDAPERDALGMPIDPVGDILNGDI